MKSIKNIVTVFTIAMLMFTMVLATSYAVSIQKLIKKILEFLLNLKKKLFLIRLLGMQMVVK
ncbi:MAG: hypothetical protein FWH29_09005 [Methanobrevibacter sp.]|nr:hypothetical protein [Methanobrevibacter sp.]